MKSLKNKTALRIIKNEELLCKNCLKSGPCYHVQEGVDDEDKLVNCCLGNKSKYMAGNNFCAQGLWVINGKAVDFKEGFQMIYDAESGRHPKEIEV